jgi:hypothetical protein
MNSMTPPVSMVCEPGEEVVKRLYVKVVIGPRQRMIASVSLREAVSRPNAYVLVSLAQKANGHVMHGDAVNPWYFVGKLHAADSGSESRSKENVNGAVRSWRK